MLCTSNSLSTTTCCARCWPSSQSLMHINISTVFAFKRRRRSSRILPDKLKVDSEKVIKAGTNIMSIAIEWEEGEPRARERRDGERQPPERKRRRAPAARANRVGTGEREAGRRAYTRSPTPGRPMPADFWRVVPCHPTNDVGSPCTTWLIGPGRPGHASSRVVPCLGRANKTGLVPGCRASGCMLIYSDTCSSVHLIKVLGNISATAN
jgi:hypothetical protein